MTAAETSSAHIAAIRPDRDGELIPVDIAFAPIRVGEMPRCVSTLRDVEVATWFEGVLDRRPSLDRAVLDAIDSQTAVLDITGEILAVNRAWERFGKRYGADPSLSGVGINYLDQCRTDAAMMPSGRAAAAVFAGITDVIAGRLLRFATDYSCPTPDRTLWFEVDVVPYEGGVVVSHHDVTHRKDLELALLDAAYVDPVTQLPNRRAIIERLAALDPAQTVAALLIDIDDFSSINDLFGRSVGDATLRFVADQLRRSTHAGDVVGHFGADTFAMLCFDLPPDEVICHARALLAAVSESRAERPEWIRPSACAGFAVSDLSPLGGLVEAADLALATAKEAGHGTIAGYSPAMRTSVDRRLRLASELRHALVDDELRVAYQPQFAMADGQLTGLEALVRWQHPEHGLLQPGEFLDVANDTGQLAAVDTWVIGAVLTQLATWLSAGFVPCPVAVNVSPREIFDPLFAQSVIAACAEHDVPTSLLQVEVTEYTLVTGSEHSLANLAQLRAAGVLVAIDDFGTGYSSLAYLAELSVDVLKIDRRFIAGMLKSANVLALVEEIVRLAHRFGMVTIAEGIETPEQHAALAAMGCDIVQGFLLGRPTTPDRIELEFTRELARIAG